MDDFDVAHTPPQSLARQWLRSRLMSYCQWATDKSAEKALEICGALPEVRDALAVAYAATATGSRPLHPASILERELKDRGWRKARVQAHRLLSRPTNETYDGYKEFPGPKGETLRLALEVEWNWERVYFDFLKFWRGQRLDQTDCAILVVRTPEMFSYATEVSWAHYDELFGGLRLVFLALDEPGLV